MRKLLLLSAVGLLVVGLFSAGAMAAVGEESVWIGGTTEEIAPSKAADSVARVFLSGGAAGACCKEEWGFDVTVRAEVAQWINWSIDATQWTWLVRKPGQYFTDCIKATLQSNGDVVVTFAGFADLARQEAGGVLQAMSSEFSFGGSATEANANGWIPAEVLNGEQLLFADSAALHNGETWKLWNRITVEDCHSVGTYQNTGSVTITIQTIQPWIEAATGNYVSFDELSDHVASVTQDPNAY